MNTYQDRLRAIRLAGTRQAVSMWDNLPDHHRERALPFARKVLPVVSAAQLLTAKNTAAHLRTHGVKPPGVRPRQVTNLRNGADPLDVYQRPFGVTWHALGEGRTLDQALREGRDRLATLVQADVLLAMKAVATLVGNENPAITGWVRVADATACDLCTAADGETYSSADDMGIHPGCGCTLDPVFGDASSSAADPEAISTHVSDELGPLLYEAGHSFAA